MEQHPEVIKYGIERRNGTVTPVNAGDLVAVVCDMYPGPIPRTHRARLGRAAKELLEDGFSPHLVAAALYNAVVMARPGMVADFALEMQNATLGVSRSWTQYRSALFGANPENEVIVNALREAFK